MISYLRGSPISRSDESVVVDVKGVGYELFCSKSTLGEVEDKKEVSLFAYTHVREDSIQLFGFSSMMEKNPFSLID